MGLCERILPTNYKCGHEFDRYLEIKGFYSSTSECSSVPNRRQVGFDALDL
jgi:hypothetical protein